MQQTRIAVRNAEAAARRVAAFGNFAKELPATVAHWLRWRSVSPEYSALGWPIVSLAELDWPALVAMPKSDLEQALVVAQQALVPSSSAHCLKATARLRAVTTRRKPVEEDEALAFAVYADKLRKYPAEAVAIASEKWMESSPFWPAVSEILQACEWAMQPRRALVQVLEKGLRDYDDAPQERESHMEELRRTVAAYGRISGDREAAQLAENELATLEGRAPRTLSTYVPGSSAVQ